MIKMDTSDINDIIIPIVLMEFVTFIMDIIIGIIIR